MEEILSVENHRLIQTCAYYASFRDIRELYSNTNHYNTNAQVSSDPDAGVEDRIHEQRKQLALQEHLLRQQQIIEYV